LASLAGFAVLHGFDAAGQALGFRGGFPGLSGFGGAVAVGVDDPGLVQAP